MGSSPTSPTYTTWFDTNIENTHRELGILIEELVDDRNRLRRIIIDFYNAERNYLDAVNDAELGDAVLITDEWRIAWDALKKEATDHGRV